jgi:hypothetical protein
MRDSGRQEDGPSGDSAWPVNEKSRFHHSGRSASGALKKSVLQIWKARKAAVRVELAKAEREARAIQEKLDRLDEAFLFERSIDIEPYDRHAENSARS